MFSAVKRVGGNLFGGMFDGQPGMFSQHQGGLPGLLASFADGQPGNAVTGVPQTAPVGNDWRQMVQMAEAPAQRPTIGGKSVPHSVERPKKRDDGTSFGRTLEDFLFTDKTWSQSKAAQRAEQAAEEQRAAMIGMARQVITDPREWMVFQTDPEEWAKRNAERLGAHTLAEGQVLTFGGQAVNGAPVVEKFDDRFGVFNPLTGESGYTEARGPTFAEETGRADQVSQAQKRIADINRAIQELDLRRQQHQARVAAGGYGTPGGGGGDAFGGMSDEQLIALLQE